MSVTRQQTQAKQKKKKKQTNTKDRKKNKYKNYQKPENYETTTKKKNNKPHIVPFRMVLYNASFLFVFSSFAVIVNKRKIYENDKLCDILDNKLYILQFPFILH